MFADFISLQFSGKDLILTITRCISKCIHFTVLLQKSSHRGFVAMATFTMVRGKKGIGCRAQIRRFKDGKCIYSEAQTHPTKTRAKQWAAKREHELDQPGAIELSGRMKILVIDLIDMYLRDFCATAGRTKLADLKTLRKYDFAQLPIDRLSAEVLIDHIRSRLITVQPQTALNDLIWLRNVYVAAYPAWGIKVTTAEIDAAKAFCQAKGMVHKSNERDRRPTAQELALLSDYFRSRDGRASIPMYDIMWFAIESSRRQAEITRLRWSDNDNENQTGMVRDIKHPRKKGLNRRFKYTPTAWAIVQRQPRTSQFIFPYNSKSVGAAFTRACHLLEIDDLHFHDLRREAVSRLFEAGYSIVEVTQFSLHGDWKTLSIYAKLKPEGVKMRG